MAQSLPSTGTVAIPTYESAGIYWQAPGGTAGCEVRFRKAGDASWTTGLPLWYDARDDQCRGSLVHLAPNTTYEAQLNLPAQPAARALTFTTWANRIPMARTIVVASGSGSFNVAEGGGPSGYVVYDGQGAVIDGQNNAQFNVTINASYVVLRGLTLRGAQQDAIRISPTVTDVIIEDNDISGWGRQRTGTFGVDLDSAIRAVCTNPTLQRVTIQRNRIHDPRYSANSWSDGHPAGPQAVAFSHCGGNHVIRHNEIYSTNGNYFNDILGGEDNFTKAGFPNADTDIYANRLSHAWDDGIEAEGANENVRIWGNYIDRTAVGVATTVTSVGPAYIFRNVWNRSQFHTNIPSLDQDERQPFFKAGTDATLGYGRRYFFHNTMLQASQGGLQYGLGGGHGMGGTGSSQLIQNTFSRNNIYHLWRPAEPAFAQTGSGNEFSHDMYSGTQGDATIVNGINAVPTYAPGHGWQSEAGGLYQLATGTAGHDAGVRIANFNDVFTGVAPDVGAHESGFAAMLFGVAASGGPAVGEGADVALTQLASTASTTVGRDVVFTLVARNNGPADANSVVVTSTIPGGASFVWASPGCGRAGSTVTCQRDALDVGAVAAFKVVLRPGSAGTLTHAASVSAAIADSASANNSASSSVSVSSAPAAAWIQRYRLYSPVTLEHHFTTDLNEYNTLGSYRGTWQQEGAVGFLLDNPGTYRGVTAVPYYRLYDTSTRWHHWTSDANEYYTLAEFSWWSAEGVDGWILPTQATGTIPLYRLLYPFVAGLHHWTIDAYEYQVLTTQQGWIGEGGSGFVLP